LQRIKSWHHNDFKITFLAVSHAYDNFQLLITSAETVKWRF
jgi:hypothetical protein